MCARLRVGPACLLYVCLSGVGPDSVPAWLARPEMRSVQPGRRTVARRSTDAEAPKSMKLKVWAPEPSGGVGADGLLAWRRRLHQTRELQEKMRLDTTPLHGGGAGARQPGARAAEVYL